MEVINMKWVCKICGYVHEGPEAPEFCPVCKRAITNLIDFYTK